MLDHDPDDADSLGADEATNLTLDQGLTEVFAILGRGLLRLRQRRRLDPVSLHQIPPESRQNRLDVPREKSVHALTTPVNGRREHREEQAR